MASTWGNNTWGSNEWQDDVILVSPTGLSTTVSVGTVEAFNTKGWGRDDFGNGAWGVEYSVALSGQQADTTLGTAVHGIGVPLEMIPNPPTGDQLRKIMRGQVGEVTIGIGAELTGVQSEFATPTLSYAGTLVGWGRDGWNDNSWGESPDQVIPLVGQELTSTVDAPTLEFAYELSGQEATTSVGSVSFVISPTVAVSGQSSTSSLGTLGVAFGVSTEPITGVAATSSIGTLGLEFGPSAITGVSATSSVGDLTTGSIELINLTGVSATSSVGSISPADVVGLTGVSATSSVGSITPVEVVQGLTTDPLTSTVGLLGIQAYANIDTGSNTSYTDVATGSNISYSSVATGSNTSYTDAA